VLTICVGKSTYARCGIIVNVTPFEPEWEGFVTLEISNTTPLPAKIYANEGLVPDSLLSIGRSLRNELQRSQGEISGAEGDCAAEVVGDRSALSLQPSVCAESPCYRQGCLAVYSLNDSRRTMRRFGWWTVFVFAVATGARVFAQTPASSPTLAADHLSADLARYYFKSPADELAARVALNAALSELGRLQGQLNSAHRLLSALRQYDAVQILFAKHENYLHLRCSLDRKDAACEANDALESDVDAKTAFLAPEILAIPEDRLNAFFDEEPALASYSFALSEIRRDRLHLLPGPEQALLDQFQPQIGDWQYGLYQQIVAGISFGTVMTAAGELDAVRQRNLIAADPDERVREEGFKRRFAGYASQRDLLAFTLIHTVQAQTSLAKAHHYADAPGRKYDSLDCKPEETRSLLDTMANHGDDAKRYEKIRSQDIEHAYHLSSGGRSVQAWDMSAPEPGFTAPITSLKDARDIYHQVFAGLGSEYRAAFDALLDPANGRADIMPGGAPNRYGGGFSVGFPGSTSILFFGRYDGTFKDLSVIAHEGGHAVHRQLMTESGVSPTYDHGPHFLFESFAEFNELVLADYMAEHAATPELKRYYRERWMSIKGLDAFYGAQDALLEQAIYDGVAAGTVRNADDLDKLTLKIDGQFSQFPASTPELRTRWSMVSLMYEDPLYDVNYVYGGLLALKFYDLYTARREWFVPRYIALLKNGFTEPPAELLRKFLNLDFSGPALLDDDLALLNRRLDQLETHPVGK
jgi:oligoendopeptidase F